MDRRHGLELVRRFFAGGIVVSLFALLGELVKPKSFAGIFAAAFGAVVWTAPQRWHVALVLALATATWLAVASCVWLLAEKVAPHESNPA